MSLNRTGTANGVISVSGSGTGSRTVTLSNLTGDGTLGISLAGNTASDLAGNTVGSVGPSQSLTIDNTPPSVSIGPPSVSATQSGPVSYEIQYGGATSIFLSPNDVNLNSTGTATGTISVSGSGTISRTITVSNTLGEGAISISIAAGTALDSVNNLAPGVGPSQSFTVDATAPT